MYGWQAGGVHPTGMLSSFHKRVSRILSAEGSASVHAGIHPPGRHRPLGRHPPGRHPPGRQPPRAGIPHQQQMATLDRHLPPPPTSSSRRLLQRTVRILVFQKCFVLSSDFFCRMYDYYLSRDFDILKIQVSPKMILGPRRSKPVTSTVSVIVLSFNDCTRCYWIKFVLYIFMKYGQSACLVIFLK